MTNKLQGLTQPDIGEPFMHRRQGSGAIAGLVSEIVAYAEIGHALSGSIETASLTIPLIINFGAPFTIALGRAPLPDDQWESFAAGLYAGPVIIDSTGGAECVQINFTPAGARRFFGLPMSELASRMVNLDDLGDHATARFRQRLGEEKDWSRRIDLAEAFVTERLSNAEQPAGVAGFAYSEILSAGGDLSMAALARRFDCSRKHLASVFRAEFGLPPKAIARVVRINRAMGLARGGHEAGWADIAAACGYADQAHLTREFSDLGGLTPETWRKNFT